MKKILFSVFALVTALLVSSCGSGSSGTAMLDLDVRIMPNKDAQQWLERSKPEAKQYFEEFSNLFTVLPGPYEFTWEELKNQDGASGYEQCATKLKIRLRLNKTLKPGIDNGYADGRQMSEERMMEAVLGSYHFEMFNAEGKTQSEVYQEDDENSKLFLSPGLANVWGANGKIGSKKNTDGILDFYHFLTSEPGTEFDLILDCQIQQCKEIEEIIAYNKGLYIQPTTDVFRNNFRIE